MAKLYYGFHFYSIEYIFAGTPNKITGCRNNNGRLAAFTSKDARDQWVNDCDQVFVCNTSSYRARQAKNATEARMLCRGMTVKEYKEHVKMITDAEVPAE